MIAPCHSSESIGRYNGTQPNGQPDATRLICAGAGSQIQPGGWERQCDSQGRRSAQHAWGTYGEFQIDVLRRRWPRRRTGTPQKPRRPSANPFSYPGADSVKADVPGQQGERALSSVTADWRPRLRGSGAGSARARRRQGWRRRPRGRGPSPRESAPSWCCGREDASACV